MIDIFNTYMDEFPIFEKQILIRMKIICLCGIFILTSNIYCLNIPLVVENSMLSKTNPYIMFSQIL